jgi:hypothetical protein
MYTGYTYLGHSVRAANLLAWLKQNIQLSDGIEDGNFFPYFK